MSTSLINTPSSAAYSEDDQYLRIGELAARTGVTQRTIRYYEEVGLLPPPTRTQGDYRLFGQRDISRLKKIIRLRDIFGFSLAEIRDTIDAEEILEQLRTEYRATEDVATRISKLDQARILTEGQLELLERKVVQIQELKTELEARLNKYISRACYEL
jgi:DNA-binding transcriptional MerR regulator